MLDQPLVLALVEPRREGHLRAAHRRAHGRRLRCLLGRRTEDRLVLPRPERRRERGVGQHAARARGGGQLARAAVLEDHRPEVFRQLGRPATLLRRARLAGRHGGGGGGGGGSCEVVGRWRRLDTVRTPVDGPEERAPQREVAHQVVCLVPAPTAATAAASLVVAAAHELVERCVARLVLHAHGPGGLATLARLAWRQLAPADHKLVADLVEHGVPSHARQHALRRLAGAQPAAAAAPPPLLLLHVHQTRRARRGIRLGRGEWTADGDPTGRRGHRRRAQRAVPMLAVPARPRGR